MKWPLSQRTTQKYLTIIWAILIIPSVAFWRNSVPWLVLMSAWANFAAHWAAYQGTTPPEEDK